MLYKEIFSVLNCTKHKNAIYVQSTEVCNVESSGTKRNRVLMHLKVMCFTLTRYNVQEEREVQSNLFLCLRKHRGIWSEDSKHS